MSRLISAFRTYDTHRTYVIHHRPGPSYDPMRHARDQIRLHLTASGHNLQPDKYAVYQYGDWIVDDKFC